MHAEKRCVTSRRIAETVWPLTLLDTREAYWDRSLGDTHTHTVIPQTQSLQPVGDVYGDFKGYVWGFQRRRIRISRSAFENYKENRVRFPAELRVVSVPDSLHTGFGFHATYLLVTSVFSTMLKEKGTAQSFPSTQNYWDFGLCLSPGILETRKYVSETESVSVLMWGGGKTPILLSLFEKYDLNRCTTPVR
jgi:hypothetical protein